jgi:outer membrane protein assembly factor BamE (lipoprotein component of BamABCDE complex)
MCLVQIERRSSMKLHRVLFLGFVGACCLLTGCIPAQQHASDVQQGLQGDKLTVGVVQREIKQGMSGAEVAQVLGSPNIVSTDEKSREVWIYDKVATDTVYSNSSGGISSLILGGGPVGAGAMGGGIGGGGSWGSGAASTSQRTLTIIIKFDESKKVREFAYHSSRF